MKERDRPQQRAFSGEELDLRFVPFSFSSPPPPEWPNSSIRTASQPRPLQKAGGGKQTFLRATVVIPHSCRSPQPPVPLTLIRPKCTSKGIRTEYLVSNYPFQVENHTQTHSPGPTTTDFPPSLQREKREVLCEGGGVEETFRAWEGACMVFSFRGSVGRDAGFDGSIYLGMGEEGEERAG